MHSISAPPLPSARPSNAPAPDLPTLVVADDHPIVGELLGRFLDTAGFRVVGGAHDGEEALRLCKTLRPALLITDLAMPRMSGLEVLRALKAEGAPTRAVVFSAMDNSDAVQQAMTAGAYGFLAKTTPFPDIVRSLEKARDGEFFFTQEAMDRIRRWVVSGRHASELSDLETGVLKHTALGRSPKELATLFSLSESGVYRSIERVKQKLDAHTPQELTLIALRRGLISL